MAELGVAARLRRGARRLGPVGFAALGLVIAVAGTAGWRASRPGSIDPGAATVRVGVRDGDSIPVYVGTSQAELDHLASGGPEVYALVPLTSYLTPDAVAALLAGAGGVRPVTAYARVPLPRRQTEIIRLALQRAPDDLVAGMDLVAARKDREPGELAAAEAAAYRGHCACVYALVVRGSPAALRGLARLENVRAVDPAPEVVSLASAVFIAPLPEQSGRVAPPPDDGGG